MENIFFDPSCLDRKIITIPLAKKIAEQEKIQEGSLYKVIIDLNLTYRGGRKGARDRVFELLQTITTEAAASGTAPSQQEGINSAKSEFSDQYLFGQFTARTLYSLVARDKDPGDSIALAKEGSLPAQRVHCAIHLISKPLLSYAVVNFYAWTFPSMPSSWPSVIR